MALTEEEAIRRYKEGMKTLTDKYGPFRVPWLEHMEVSEPLRAFHIIMSNGGAVSSKLLSQYMVSPRVAEQALAEIGVDGVVIDMTHKPSRADQYKAFEQWASDHDSEQYTTDQLVEVSGFSYPTVLRFIDGNPHFHKVKKGLYECRNAKVRREQAIKAEKNTVG